MKIKGYQTSEFWFTLVSFIISGLFLGGVILEADTKDDLISVSTHVVESIILIGGQFALFGRHMSRRRREQQEDQRVSKELEDYVGVDRIYNKISINTANIGELIQLPHVGPVTAQRIVDYRKANLFEDLGQLKSISGVGESSYQDIEPYIEL
jgi:competence ComEA-like helix-hairpin-helix protein|tara:strand:- start:141 stop:599 length:459 start_codon:yes stop_codon:yes gene_type:complete